MTQPDTTTRDLLIGLSPFEAPDAALVVALGRAGALGVLDLGHDRTAGLAALAEVAGRLRRYGVRIPERAPFTPADAPGAAVVVLPAGVPAAPWRRKGRTLLIQVTSLDEARTAEGDGLIAKGNESGGRVEEESSFILLQRLIAERPDAAIWVQGGIGLHTAAACLAGGARGVVVDSQLALVEESSLPGEAREVLKNLDGSETVVESGRRMLVRGGLRLAAGQDVAFARPLAARGKTAAGVVRALRRAVDGHLRQARELDPLAEGSPLARELGVRFPIAQGPMTRVSDRAGFAGAVASAGALPFLALSLMRGAEARQILGDVEAAGHAWGVGILGFVPPELRDEQLAMIRELRPPVALIAGGRPSQSRPLEEAGIKTFLHVPSPGLLDLFLTDGARRFVLEGRECGGHVGPRSSFVLWEAAIERLLAQPQAAELSVLFAGGIHDARSAAMVAAAAAPLAARGAKIGVLLGTAYLFTEEAVATGAIQQGFQEVALACERTVLLDTAPGHSTRCAETDYVRAFRAERERLEHAGHGHKETWEALEQLNLGRLRIAAKGIAREAGGLRAVDDETQRRDGMFMLGQVAALRRRVVTMAELHRDVSQGCGRVLAAARVPAARPLDVADVAIVGMAAIFPGAPTLDAYWKNIVAGKNAISEVPRERWNVDLYYDADGTGDKTPSRWGGFLPDVAFDPAAYGIPPRSLAAIEPVQLLALEVARRALDDSGYGAGGRELERERASVIFGAEAGTDLSAAYGFRAQHRQLLGELPPALDEALPRLTEDSFPGVLANVIAGRIANRLDLGGVNYTVDAACASSLAAVDLACKELASGTSDLVLAGGADLHNGINDYLMFASVHALSPRGQCRPFDAGADGIVLGEGVGVVVLKRLADAERDGDRVYAVIKGVGGSSDGKSLGLTAPRPEGQLRALERAYARAGVSPAEVELVEAHGTGTVVGDRTELAVLGEVFEGAGALPGRVTLGSVKSQIGHTKCAAGIAGLIKAALAIHHRVLPPTGNLEKTTPGYEPGRSPFVFRNAAGPWPSERRRAGVSAFGFGGTNFHVVLEDAPGTAESGVSDWPAELFLVRAGTRAEAEQVCARLAALAESGGAYRLRDLAAGVAARPGPVQLAFVADSLADLAQKCRAPRAVSPQGGKLAVLFPGQGSQRPGMLADLMVAFPAIQEPLHLGRAVADRIYPGAALAPEERTAQAAALTDTRVAQPALGMVELALSRLLARLGVEADLLGGHSYGELVALVAAGALDAGDLVALSGARARCILDAARGAPGTMAAVGASPRAVEALLPPGVVMANLNAPEQVVIAGSDEAIEAACARLAAAGLTSKRIPVACAFHSPIVAGAADAFARCLAGVAVRAPDRPVYANSTAAPYPADGVRELLAGQIARPVRFAEEIEAMYAAGARVFVEAGPGSVLTGLVGKILAGRPHLAVALDGGLPGFLTGLAALAGAGVTVDPAPLFAGRDVRPIDPFAPPPAGPPATAWWVNGQRAWPMHGSLPDFAMKPVLQPIVPAPAASDRETTVMEYLRGMRELVDAQKQVMLRYLGQAPAETVAVSETVAVAVPVTEAVAVAVAAPARKPLELLIQIVSERTGYPADMLDPDLDLEADLGIDSIKRIEILGTLGERLALPSAGDGRRSEMIEELSTVKTLRKIAAWLEEKIGEKTAAPAAVPEAIPEDATPEPVLAEGSDRTRRGLDRYVLSVQPISPARPNGLKLDERRFVISDDGRGIAERLAELLAARGASARIIAGRGDEALGAVDGLVHLSPLAQPPPADPVKALFALAKQAISGGATWLIAATGMGGAFGHSVDGDDAPTAQGAAGVAGLLKSIAREHPEMRVRSADLALDDEAPAETLDAIAADLLAEMLSDDPRVEVGYRSGVRQGLVAVPSPRGRREDGPVELDERSVVLLTGGARGITAEAALELARRFGCSLELVGRTPLPLPNDDGEPADVEACLDATALRRLLAQRGGTPAAINAEVGRLLSAREIKKTLAELRLLVGERVRYHAVDLRDRPAFAALLDDVYARHGRLDGVIHGAGVIEDRLLADKTQGSFDRVFDTKVEGALTLLDKLRPDVRFVVFFSSISGAFGNRGQSDYAAANDALDKLAHQLSRRVAGRVVSINWGPWAGAGMVSPELEREYARRGIGLIHPEEGVAHLIDEVVHGGTAQVILLRAGPERLRDLMRAG